MLKKIDVTSLFGLYSYDLDFNDIENQSVKFITGPNGYGKTTILTLIHSLCLCRFDTFLQVPFERIGFFFDGATVELIQIHKGELEDERVDESCLEKVFLKIHFSYTDQENQVDKEDFEWNRVDRMDRGTPNLSMSLSSLSCYYIKDQRLRRKQMISPGKEEASADMVMAVKDNADDLCGRLDYWRKQLNEALNASKLVFNTSVDEADYNRRKERLLPVLERLKKFGVIEDGLVIKDYSTDNALFVSAFLIALENAIGGIAPFMGCVETFFDIIERSHFANKKMEINPRYGYRLIMDNELRTILSLTSLSSGEQHILIQSYELLFKAQENALVLIDEPEMSYHLMWQMDYLKNLQSIIARRKIQCIVSTHSPQIFSMDWKLTVDLYEQSKRKDE